MILATIRVHGVCAKTVSVTTIPRGIIGAKVQFEYADPMWDGLTKTVVFRAGDVTKDVLNAGDLVDIPPEVVSEVGSILKVGIYGEGIPTLWADLGRVRDAADPSGDESTDPSLPVWAQLQNQIDDLKQGEIPGGNSPGSTPGNTASHVVQDTPPEDTSVLWVDPTDNSDDGFQKAVNTALAQAKESGAFDGKDGYTPVKGVDYFDGQPGYTPKKGVDYFDGEDGKDYVLTEEDKTEIAEQAAGLVEVPEGSSGGIAVTGAKVGQTVKISAVDENGVPTAWESVDFPSGGGEEVWEDICDITFTEDVLVARILMPDAGIHYKKIEASGQGFSGKHTALFSNAKVSGEHQDTYQSVQNWVVLSLKWIMSGYTRFSIYPVADKAFETVALAAGISPQQNDMNPDYSPCAWAIAGNHPAATCFVDSYSEGGINQISIYSNDNTTVIPAGARLQIRGVRA